MGRPAKPHKSSRNGAGSNWSIINSTKIKIITVGQCNDDVGIWGLIFKKILGKIISLSS